MDTEKATINQQVINKPDFLTKVQKGAKVGILLVILGFIGNKVYQKIRRDQSLKRAETAEVQQAIKLYSAMNPSGISWLRAFDTTDEEALYDTAKDITGLKQVIKEYKNLYGRSLMDDLQKELSSEEFSKFTLLVNNKYADADAPVKDIEKSVQSQGKYVLTTGTCRFYSSVNSYLVPFGGYFHTEQPNRCIGVVAKDESIRSYRAYYVSPVTLVKVYVKTIQGYDKYFYVDMDDVKLVSKEEYYKIYQPKYPYYQYADKIFE